MTTELSIIHYGAIALVVTGWIGILAYAGLKGWNGWLALKRAELDMVAARNAAASAGPAPLSAATTWRTSRNACASWRRSPPGSTCRREPERRSRRHAMVAVL